MKRRTAKKKLRAELKEITDWLKRERNRLKTGELLRQAKSGFGGLPFEAVIAVTNTQHVTIENLAIDAATTQ